MHAREAEPAPVRKQRLGSVLLCRQQKIRVVRHSLLTEVERSLPALASLPVPVALQPLRAQRRAGPSWVAAHLRLAQRRLAASGWAPAMDGVTEHQGGNRAIPGALNCRCPEGIARPVRTGRLEPPL